MLESGLTIYLKLTPLQLRSRLSESKGERPLIKDLDQDELQSFIEKKLADRERWYDRSDINLLLSHVKSKSKHLNFAVPSLAL
jgi:shikimate kinase